MSKYIDWVKKKTCLGVLERGDRDKTNETGLKEGGGIQMSTTVLPLRDARSLSLLILTVPCNKWVLDYLLVQLDLLNNQVRFDLDHPRIDLK